MPTYKELETQRSTKAAELKTFLDSKKDDGGGYAMTDDDIGEARRRNTELEDLGSRVDAARELAQMETAAIKAARLPLPNDSTGHPKGGPEEPGTNPFALKSLGDSFLDTDEAKQTHGTQDRYTVRVASSGMSNIAAREAAIKAVMTTQNGFSPQNNRGPVIVPFATRRPMIADLIPQDNTENSVIRYMEFTTWVNGSAPVAEGGVKPMSSLGATERDVTLQAIATLLPVTEQQLRYVPMLKPIIDNVLTAQLQLTEETQLLYGNGTSPNLQGFLTKAGVNSYAQGTVSAKENIADAFYQAFTQVRVIGFSEPEGCIIHPNDWATVRLMKTTQDAYIWGNPDEAGPERMWGKLVVPTTAIAAGAGLTGAFSAWSHIDRALEITIEVGYINDDFARNQKTIRAEEYLALEIYRPTAFSALTGLAAVAP